jgi:hypothetical protein
MTDLLDVPDGSPAEPGDLVMVLRAGAPMTITIAELAATFQDAINLAAGTLVGRSSNTAGGPQQITFGPGATLAGTEFLLNGEDHLGFTLLAAADFNCELIVNSAGQPARLPFLLAALGIQSVASSLAAIAGGQSAALPLTARVNVVTTVPSGGGVILTVGTGGSQQIFNRCGTGQELAVYPTVGRDIEGNATNVAVTIPDGGSATFTNDGTMFRVS